MLQVDFEAVLDQTVADAKDQSPVAIACSVLNSDDGRISTLVKGETRSMIALTLISSALAKDNAYCQMIDIFRHSDHRAITAGSRKSRKTAAKVVMTLMRLMSNIGGPQ